MKVYSLTVRNPVAALALGLAIVSIGAALLLVGLTLLAGLAVVGGVLGVGLMLYRRLRFGRDGRAGLGDPHAGDLDPALEVFPERPVIGMGTERPGPDDP